MTEEHHTLLTVDEACKLLNISRRFFYELVGRDELRIIKFGTRTRVRRTEVTQFIDKKDTVRVCKNCARESPASIRECVACGAVG
jgi:excisionase family DNA binding protein